MKQKMSTADVAGEVACLHQRIVGMRLANIYDINQKTYLLKCARSGENGEKVLVVLEAGVRFHSTEYARDKSDLPAPFAMKLRKHLRGKRVTGVAQLGVDRIVDFTLGTSEAAHHLLLEIYAAGNVVLTDASYKVLAAQRAYKDDARGWAVAPGLLYPVSMIRMYKQITADALQSALQDAGPKFTLKNLLGKQLPYGPMLAEHCILNAGLAPARHPAGDPLSADEVAALATQLRGLDSWLDSCKDTPPRGFILLKPAVASAAKAREDAAAGAVADGGSAVEAGDAGGNRREQRKAGPVCPPGMMYDDFDPLQLRQKADKPVLEFDSFNAALDEFYSKIESQRQVQQQAAAEAQARGRVAKVQTDLEQRTAALERHVVATGEAGRLIEAHADAVDAAILAINGQLATGMDWTDIERLLEEEKARGAPIACMIESLALAESRATLLLRDGGGGGGESGDTHSVGSASSVADGGSEPEDPTAAVAADDTAGDAADAGGVEEPLEGAEAPGEQETEQGEEGGRGAGTLTGAGAGGGAQGRRQKPRRRGPSAQRVVVDLTENAFGNAKQYYDERRQAREKLEKTARAGSKAVRAAAARTEAQLSTASTTAKIQLLRKTHWFEKFLWFVTTEGYLVLSGRDAQQNEILVRRYMKSGDVYVHADEHGAATTIVKNHLSHREISPVSLTQAGAAAICRSKAWDAKVVTSAWWVHAHQVSKTAPTGEALTTGSFMIRGRKNFLPPTQMVMGFTFLFRLDEGSIARHRGERAVAGGDDGADQDPSAAEHAEAPVEGANNGEEAAAAAAPLGGWGCDAGADVAAGVPAGEESVGEEERGPEAADAGCAGDDVEARESAHEEAAGGDTSDGAEGGESTAASEGAAADEEEGGRGVEEEAQEEEEEEEEEADDEELLAAFLDGTVGQTSAAELVSQYD
eukprot:jgi/Ulvmu1/631/UM010_0001.1